MLSIEIHFDIFFTSVQFIQSTQFNLLSIMSRPVVYIFQIIILVSQWLIVYAHCGCNVIKRSKNDIFDTLLYDAANRNVLIKNDICPNMQYSPMLEEMIKIGGGNYMIGNSEPIFRSDGESPQIMVHINEFYIDKYEVSNAQFDEFIKDTGYVTNAEKYGDSFVFEGLLNDSQRHKYRNNRVMAAPWWYKVNGTCWRTPEGITSTIDDRMDHPVVHVSWFDALKFCKWKNKRLPTEIEWEIACRGGKNNKLFPWGNKLNAKNQHW